MRLSIGSEPNMSPPRQPAKVSRIYKQGLHIRRHFNRKNLCDGLLLSETSMWYDFIGKEKSLEVSETYLNIPIPESDTSMICSGGKLPEFILFNNGDVLKKRKETKILILGWGYKYFSIFFCIVSGILIN